METIAGTHHLSMLSLLTVHVETSGCSEPTQETATSCLIYYTVNPSHHSLRFLPTNLLRKAPVKTIDIAIFSLSGCWSPPQFSSVAALPVCNTCLSVFVCTSVQAGPSNQIHQKRSLSIFGTIPHPWSVRASATKVMGPDAERFSCYPRVCLAWWWDRLHCGNYHITFQTGRYRESDRAVLMGNAYIWGERSMDKWPKTKCRMLHNNLLQIHTSWSW